jgi:hypothetical protein
VRPFTIIMAMVGWTIATVLIASALTSMIVGGIVTGTMYICGWYPMGWWPSVWGAAVTCLLFVGVSLRTLPPPGGAALVDGVESDLRAQRA